MRLHRHQLRAPAAAACMFAGLCSPAQAAVLKPFSRITAATVHLADLFDELGSTADRLLGPAPLPGARIVVGAPQLAAIARDFNVDWRPASGSEQAVIERTGDRLPRDAVLAAVRHALRDAGAPADMEMAVPDLPDIIVPTGSTVHPEISQVSYDDGRGNFSALVTIAPPDMPVSQLRISGTVIAMLQTAVAQRRLAPGTLVGAEDVRQMRVRASLLHGAAPLLPANATGLTVKHALSPGQAISVADLARTPLVLRGDHVRMVLVSDGLSLSAQGLARAAGARGDRIEIENPISHLLVEGEVIGADEVRVAPRPAAISLVSAQ